MSFPIRTLRRFNESRMDEETDVLRQTEVETEPGYPTVVWNVVQRTVSRGRALGASEQIVANQAGYTATGRRFLPFGTDVAPEDRLKVGETVYEIESVDSETSPSQRAAVECLVRRRN